VIHLQVNGLRRPFVTLPRHRDSKDPSAKQPTTAGPAIQ